MANNNHYIQLLIDLGVSDNSKNNINEYIKQLKGLDKVKVELEVDGMSSANKGFNETNKIIKELQEQVKQLKGELKGLGSTSLNADGLEDFKKEIGKSIKSIGDLEKRVKDFNGTMTLNYSTITNIDPVTNKEVEDKVLKSINTSMTDVDGSIKNLTFRPVLDEKGFIQSLDEIRETVKKVDFKDFDAKAEKTAQLMKELGRQGNLSADDLSGFESRLENLKVDKSVSDLERLNTELKEMNKELSHEAKMDNSMANINKQAQDLAQTLNKLNNVEGLNKLQISQYVNELERLSSVDIKTDSQLKEVNSDFKSVEDGIKSLVKEANRLSKVDNEIEKLQTTIEKLRSQGSLSSSQANQFLLDTKEVEKTTEAVKKLENQINKIANETTSTNKIKNALEGISPTVDRLNEKLDLTVKKLGGNVDASALEKIKKEILEISNTNINTTDEIAKLNTQISQTEKSITQLSVSANHIGRFEDYVRKTEKALIDLERSGYATEDTINEFKNTLKNIPIGDLAKVKELLNQIDDEMSSISHNNKLADSIQRIHNDLGKLDAQFEKTKNLYSRTFDRAEAEQVAKTIDIIRNSLEKLPKDISLIKQKDLDTLKNGLAQANIEVKQFNANATTSVRNSVGLVDALKTAYSKFPIWMLASTSFYSTIRGIQDLTEKVIELDSAIVNLARVSDANQFELDKVISRANEEVTALSGNMTDFLELVSEFARTGKTIDESFDLAKTTTTLLNISDLNATDSMNALTAAMIAFKIEAEDSMRIADRINEVDNNFAISSKNISDAMLKASSTAAVYGVTIDELIGHITAVGETTRESGSVIGNSLKTIYSRITTNRSAINALSAIGISMEDSAGQAKNASQLLKEVANRWDGLSEAQQRSTAVGISGVYQLGRWNALMLNYNQALQATETSMDSYNSAMREQEVYNQSLEARINRLQTAWYGLADSLGNTIIYDGLVVGTKALEAMTGTMSTTTSAGAGVGVVFGVIGAGALLASTRFRTWSASMVTATGSAIANRTANTALATSLGAVATSATTATTAVKSFMAATGIGLVIVAATTALTALMNAYSDSIQKGEEFDSYLQKNTDALTVNKEKVDELISSYTNLSNTKENGKLTTEQEEKLVEVQNQLAELYPALVDYVDANGNAHLKAASMIDAETEAIKELIKAEQEVQRQGAEDSFNDILKDLEKANKERQRLAENLDKTRNKRSTKDVAELELHLARLDKEIVDKSAEISNSVLEIADAFTDVGEKIDDTINTQIRDALANLDFSELDASELKEFAKTLADIRIALNDALASNSESGFEKARQDLENLINSVNGTDQAIASGTLDFDEMTKSANQMGASLESADESMDGLGESADALSEELADLLEKSNEYKDVQEKLAGVNQYSIDKSQELIFMYEQLTLQLKGYTDAQLQDLLNKPKLTAEEKVLVQAMQQRGDVITLLNGLYPQYAVLQQNSISLSAQQVDAMKREEEANRVLLEAYELASQGKYNAEQSMTLAQAQGTKTRIENIKAEIAALNVLQQEAQKAYDEIMKNKDIYNDDNAGRGAMRAGTILGQAQFRTEQKTSDLSALQNELDGLIGKVNNYNTSIKETSKSTKDATKSSYKSTKESIYITDKYKQKMEELNLAIEKQNKLQSQYPQHTAKYRSALEGELKLQQQKLDLINSQTKALDAQIKSGKIAQTGTVSSPTSGTTTTSKATTVSASGWTGQQTSRQGNRLSPITGKAEYHRGIDLASPQGTKLVANYAGKVIASGLAGRDNNYHQSYGNVVVIQDKDGNKHLYAHLEKAIAKLGDTIEKGMQIGTVGSTGSSTGSHLHYEVSNSKGVLQDAATFAKEARTGSLSITQQVTETTKAVASNQQAIDEAKSTLIDLQSDALAQQEKIAQIQEAIRESMLAEFDYKRDNYDSNISHEIAKLKTLDKESVRYNKTLDLMTKYMEQKQSVNEDELKYLDDLIAKGGLSEVAIEKLTARKLELKTAIHELNAELQSFKLDNIASQYEDLYDTITDKIAQEEAKLQHLNTSSERYTQTLRKLSGSYEEQARAVQQNINAIQKLIDTNQVNGEYLEKAVDQINDLKVELENLHKQIMDKNYEVVVNIKTQYDDQTDDLQFEIDRSKAIMGMYEEGTANYNNEIKNQIELTKQQMSLYDKSRRELQKEMQQTALTAEQKKELMEQMEDLSLSYVNAEASIRSMTKALEDSNKRMLESIAEAYVSAYREFVREISEEHMNMLDEQLESEQEAYDKRKKLMNEELDLFRKNVEEKLRLIRRQEDERSYQKDLDKMEKDRNDIQRQINLLSLDNSYEAKKKREKLLKELDKIDEDIAEHKHQRDIELQEQALNDLLELKEEEFREKEEYADKEYDMTVKQINRQKEYWQKYYRDLENDERKFTQIREDIMNGHFDKVNAEFESHINQLVATMPKLVDSMDGTMQGVGTAIRQNVIDQLREAMSMVDEYKAKMDEMSSWNADKFVDDFNPNDGKSDLPTSTSPSDGGSQSGKQDLIKGVGDIKVVVGKYMTDILANTETNKVRAANIREKAHALAAQGRAEGSTIPVNQHVDRALSAFSKQDKENIKDYVYGNASSILQTDYLQEAMRNWAASLDTGGYLNFKSSGGLDGKGGKALIAHDGEVVLNKVQTNRLLDNIEVSDGMLSKITNMSQMFSSILKSMSPTLSLGGGYGDITVNFGDVHNATQEQAQNFATEFINRVNTIKGGF